MSTKTNTTPGYVNIVTAQTLLGLNPMYTRKLVTDPAKFPNSIKTRVPGTEIPRWEVSLEDIEAYKAGAATRTKSAPRTDGRVKFEATLNAEEFEAVQNLLKKMGAPALVRPMNNYQKAKAKAAAGK